MPRRIYHDIARLYHLNSSRARSFLPDLTVDNDRRPFRFRSYPGAPRVDLPGRDFELPMPLGEALLQRRSVRDFSHEPLGLESVGRLLYTSYGLRGYRQSNGIAFTDRPTPSAGGLYPLELYVATEAIEGLADGLYHYDVRAHQLELRRTESIHRQLVDMTFGQQVISTANLVIVISGIFERTIWKYGQRGYRFILLEAGHLGQNLYLSATAQGLGAVALGDFFDDEINRALDLPLEEEALYIVCVGQLKEPLSVREPDAN